MELVFGFRLWGFCCYIACRCPRRWFHGSAMVVLHIIVGAEDDHNVTAREFCGDKAERESGGRGDSARE